MEPLILIPLLFVAITPVLYVLAQYNVMASLRQQSRRAWVGVHDATRRRNAVLAPLVEKIGAGDPAASALSSRLKESLAGFAVPPETAPTRDRDEMALVDACRAILSRTEESAAPEAFAQLRREDEWLQESIEVYRLAVGLYHQRITGFPGSRLAPRLGFAPLPGLTFSSVLPENRSAPPTDLH